MNTKLEITLFFFLCVTSLIITGLMLYVCFTQVLPVIGTLFIAGEVITLIVFHHTWGTRKESKFIDV